MSEGSLALMEILKRAPRRHKGFGERSEEHKTGKFETAAYQNFKVVKLVDRDRCTERQFTSLLFKCASYLPPIYAQLKMAR